MLILALPWLSACLCDSCLCMRVSLCVCVYVLVHFSTLVACINAGTAYHLPLTWRTVGHFGHVKMKSSLDNFTKPPFASSPFPASVAFIAVFDQWQNATGKSCTNFIFRTPNCDHQCRLRDLTATSCRRRLDKQLNGKKGSLF